MRRKLFRWQRRGWLVVNNGLNLVIVPALSVVVSVLVVRLHSADLWGALVGWFLLVQLGAHFVAWGNKDYLVRQFSQNPANIAAAWQTSWVTRAVILIPVGLWLALQSDSVLRAFLLVAWCALLAFDQAFEAPVMYYRKFGLGATIDFLGLVMQVIVIVLVGARLDLNLLILIFVFVTLFKAVVLLILFGHTVIPRGWVGRFDWHELRASFPLFLLTLSGMLASRADAYAVNALLPRDEVAQYQVYLSFLLMLQTGAAVLLLPFVRNLYRLGAHAFLRQSARLAGIGIIVSVGGVLVISRVVPLLYHWTLTLPQLVMGVFVVLPTFFYIPIIYALYQQKREMVVVVFSFAAAAVSVTLSVWLLPQFGLIGGLVGNACGQVLLAIGYAFAARRISRLSLVSRIETAS